ncbi:MAG: DUF4097 family beta strand repeat protein [candidate division Zixibacteria bacterium]|nr:DUF4097 family beta strand repeat protein [candidate division Zixibacteria bacterium]
MKNILVIFLILTVSSSAQWEFEESSIKSAEAIRNIVIDCPVGIIEIEQSSDNNIYADFRKTFYCDDEGDAKEMSGEIIFDFQVDNSTAQVNIELPRHSRKRSIFKKLFNDTDKDGLDIMLKIKLPKGINLEIQAASADIFVSDIDNQTLIKSASSDVVLENITGDCDIRLASGDIEAMRIFGKFNFSGSSSDFQFEDIKGDMDISTSSGDGFIETAKGNLKVSTTSGDVKLYSLDGDLSFQSTSGDLKSEDISGEIDAKSTSGSLKMRLLKNTEGRFNLNTISGDVYLELPQTFGGDLVIETVSGSIESQLDMKTNAVSDSYFKGRIGSGSGKIYIETVSGDIAIESY